MKHFDSVVDSVSYIVSEYLVVYAEHVVFFDVFNKAYCLDEVLSDFVFVLRELRVMVVRRISVCFFVYILL